MVTECRRRPRMAPFSNTATSIEASLSDMLAELQHRCPAICPSVLPSTLTDCDSGVALLGTCKRAEERRAFAAFLTEAREAAGGICALTSSSVPSASELRFVSLWDLQPKNRSCKLKRCVFACSDVATLLDTTALLERFSKVGASDAELGRLAQIFWRLNHGHDSEPSCSNLDATLWLQECLALAHACKVVASNLSSWRAVTADGEVLSESGSTIELAQRMLANESLSTGHPHTAQPKAGNSSKKRGTDVGEATSTMLELAAEEDRAEGSSNRSARSRRRRSR
jgi:hypothetical protein